MTTDPKTLDDEALIELDDAITAEYGRRRHLPFDLAVAMAALTDDELHGLADLVSDESQARAERAIQLQAAHAIEQGEAQEQANSQDERAKLVHRSDRLFKLARIGAPSCILSQALQQVNKWKPEE